jgi:hypothetical protein
MQISCAIKNFTIRDSGILTSSEDLCQGCSKRRYTNQGEDMTTIEAISDDVLTYKILEIDIKRSTNEKILEKGTQGPAGL